MAQPRQGAGWKTWAWRGATLLGLVVVVVLLVAGCGYLFRTPGPVEAKDTASQQRAQDPPEGQAGSSEGTIQVEVTHPKTAGTGRTSTQPGSAQAFESVDLYAGVSGYLGEQKVDIDDRIKKGDTLAKLDVPDLDAEVLRAQAAKKQADARVEQMSARVVSARADLEAAKAAVIQAESNARSKKALLVFHTKQLKRFQDLLASGSIDARLVDEEMDRRDAAKEAADAAIAAITTSKAQQDAAQARIDSARADLDEARAEVNVAEDALKKAEAMVEYSIIKAPFDGVITRRNFFVRDYIQAANAGGAHSPLFTVQRTDKFRIIVQVPDRDVPYTHKGDKATVQFEALGTRKFPGEVSRIAHSEDPDTRLMHVEIDVQNPTGQIYNGMYGRATIFLDSARSLHVPSSALAGKAEGGKGYVYVVRDGHAHLTEVQIGQDNGIEVEVLGGLTPDDEVITDHGGVTDGAPVVSSPNP